jgi:medium-chain acyl-[acyl-carrier-protein] hydrolase
MSSSALPRRLPPGSAGCPLLCLPYAGGGTRAYERWQRLLPGSVDALTLRLPGRESRSSEPLPADLRVLAADLAAELAPCLNGPFAIFGHSVGALLAYEMACALRARYAVEPRCLFVSGMPAPQLLGEPLSRQDRDDAELRAMMARSADPAILGNTELWELLAPAVRSDLAMGDTYRHAPAQQLSCPLVAYGATRDAGISEASLNAWSLHTTGPFHRRILPGDHFYFNQWPAILATDLTSRISQYLREGQ